MSHTDQSQDGLETSVIDISLARQRPALDGLDHPIDHLLSRWLRDCPSLGTIADHVGKHAGSVVAHLKAYEKSAGICFIGPQRAVAVAHSV